MLGQGPGGGCGNDQEATQQPQEQRGGQGGSEGPWTRAQPRKERPQRFSHGHWQQPPVRRLVTGSHPGTRDGLLGAPPSASECLTPVFSGDTSLQFCSRTHPLLPSPVSSPRNKKYRSFWLFLQAFSSRLPRDRHLEELTQSFGASSPAVGGRGL